MNDRAMMFLPGMGADERIFAPMVSQFPSLIVPPWLTPHDGETLEAYARRWAMTLRDDQPSVLGGTSFGGFVASEMVRWMPEVDVVVLIASVPCAAELPRRIRMLRRLRRGARMMPFELMSAVSDVFSRGDDLAAQFANADPAFLRWACEATLDWSRERNDMDDRIIQIHGRLDQILPLHSTEPHAVIEEAGHLPTITHDAQVNALLARIMKGLDQSVSIPVIRKDLMGIDGVQTRESKP